MSLTSIGPGGALTRAPRSYRSIRSVKPERRRPKREGLRLEVTLRDARIRSHRHHRRRVHGGADPRIHHPTPRALADRRLPAGRRARRAAHAGLRRRRRPGRAAGRDRRHPPDVRRRAAVPLRRAAGRARRRRAGRDRAKRGRDAARAPPSRIAFGWSWPAAIVFGLAMSVASTVVLVRVLADNHDLHTPTGHIAVGWLVVEDLFTVVVLVLLPALFGARAASGPDLALALGLTALKVAGLVAFTVVVGTRVIPWLLDRVAATRSRELFTLTVLALALGIAVGAADGLRRLDGAGGLSRGHGRRPVRVQPAGRVRGAADARRLRRAVLRLGRHAARPASLLEAPLLVGGDAGGRDRWASRWWRWPSCCCCAIRSAWPLPWRSRWRRSASSRSSWRRWAVNWACCHRRP